MKHRRRIGFGNASALAAASLCVLVWLGGNARADMSTGSSSSSAASSSSGTEVAQASPSSATIDELRQEIQEERARTAQLESRLDQLQSTEQQQEQSQSTLQQTLSKMQAGRGNEKVSGGQNLADIYDRGFFLRSKYRRFSLYINGLAQIRYSFFKPNSVGRYDYTNRSQSDFEVYLARLAFSGNIFEPNLKYFFQIQGFTTGNSNNMTLLDWFMAKTFSPYLTIQAGRSWTAYTWEFYANPAWLTFPDLSDAEYAFVLPRATGLAAYGQYGKLSYEAELTNGIPALDAGGNENINSNMAYIGHLQYDILAPAFFGFAETHPEDSYAEAPGLSVWGSGMYNPVNSNSTFENEMVGDSTYGGNASVGFRWGYFTAQGTGYYRRTQPGNEARAFGVTTGYNSWGYAEQTGYYLVPGKWEIAQRISGIWWGQGEIPQSGTPANPSYETYWFSGPDDFSYNRLTEYTAGLNYYLYGHNAKIEFEYSYLAGKDFNSNGFGASRLWIQSQLQF
ncbi:MAG TPA: hypothetical protein VMF50_02175 [Candidatus Binataceae bacterium]|nr:hypothetical protein [Candidatus Binataceae bacterium]